MFDRASEKVKVLGFVSLAWSAAALIAFGAPSLRLVYPFLPTLVTLLMLFVFTKEGYRTNVFELLGLRKLGRSRYLLLAFAMPFGVLSLSFTLAWIIWPELRHFAAGEIDIIRLVISAAVYILVQTAVFSLGEEIGWRGYLLPRLCALLDSEARASVMLGVIWALWHYPLIFAGLYATGVNNVHLAILLTILLVPLNVIISFLRLRSKSLWPAALAHGTHNALWSVLGQFAATTPLLFYISGEVGLLTIIGYSIAALCFLRQPARRAISRKRSI